MQGFREFASVSSLLDILQHHYGCSSQAPSPPSSSHASSSSPSSSSSSSHASFSSSSSSEGKVPLTTMELRELRVLFLSLIKTLVSTETGITLPETQAIFLYRFSLFSLYLSLPPLSPSSLHLFLSLSLCSSSLFSLISSLTLLPYRLSPLSLSPSLPSHSLFVDLPAISANKAISLYLNKTASMCSNS